MSGHNTSNRKIDTVIFDIGGVLAGYHTKDYFIGKGYSEETAERLQKATMLSPYWKEYDRGVMTDEEIRGLFKQLEPELAEEIDRSLTKMTGMITRREASIPWIRDLQSGGLQVLVLSNFSDTAHRDNEEALDFLNVVDGGILSWKDKVIKPDPEIYELLIARYQLNPERCVFIDDTEINLTAASAFGIHTILYRTEEQVKSELEKLI